MRAICATVSPLVSQALQDSYPPLGRRAARREAGGEFEGGRGLLYAAGLLGGFGHGGSWDAQGR